MIDLSNIASDMQEDIESVNAIANELYDKYFADYFADERELYTRFKSKDNPITDTELEWILTSLPLQLFSVSEALTQFKISQAVVKLRVKQEEVDRVNASALKSETKRKEEASLQMLEHKLFLTVYTSVANRVENEISFSRELIMSAKKIWDGRKQTENSNPVGEVNPENALPEYVPPEVSGKSYIG